MNKRHRIFIAINLPSDIKKYLAGFEKKWPELPAKWTPQDNLHITMVFLGDIADEQLGQVCLSVRDIAKNHQIFGLSLNKVSYGPDDKIPPRMVWALGEKSKELSMLKNDLQDALLETVHFVPETKAFSPHVTLARISVFAWRRLEPEERPEVGEAVDLNFTVESIDVMESEMKKGGPRYVVIESCGLQ